jgi:protein-serine/threonine kinase
MHDIGPQASPGRVIDGFRLDEHLHRGGMAELWRVSRVDGGDDTLPLIMKLPRVRGTDEPASIVGYEVERMILPRLSGPHVPAFVAMGDFTRMPYLVMERIPGASLRPRLEQAPLPLAEVADIGARVATALHELHRQHVVHLDVKPSNVMFRPDGRAVLVDFGLSRHDQLPDLLDEELTVPLGTGPYMSPEQLHFVRRDPRSDQFALGVMLYHLVTGARPFGAPSNVRGLRRRLYTEPVPPRAITPDCPPWLQEIILRCLEVDPDARYQTAAQLALMLDTPDEVALTDRAARTARGPLSAQVGRWWKSMGVAPSGADTGEQLARSPIIVVAVDIENAEAELLQEVREHARRIVSAEAGARLAVMCVMRSGRIAPEDRNAAPGRDRHVQQLVQLKHWARPIRKALDLADDRLTCHVIEGSNPAATIVEFARRCQADHIVMGARASSAMRRYLGSVSSQVVAEADCSVTVVRQPAARQ